MPVVTLEAFVPDADSDTVFARISDFERYAEYTEAVREIRIDSDEGGSNTSTWSVNFRGGVLRWREVDHIDPLRRRIDYEQIEGDFEQFDGTWEVAPSGTGARVTFTAAFDLGMPSLAAMLEPVAKRALRENIEAILKGLLGTELELLSRTEAAATS